jgi:hypothetical protein
MARFFFTASDGRDGGEVSACGAANEAGPFTETQRGGFDEAALSPKLSLRSAGGKRMLNFAWRQRPDGDSDAPLTEVALGIEVAGRCAPDRGMTRNVDRVGD